MKNKLILLILIFLISVSSGFSQDNALTFPGNSGTHVDLGSTMDVYNKQNLTVEMWVNPNNLSPADCFFSLPGSDYTLAFTLGTPWSMVRVEFGSGNTASTPSGILYDQEWFHLAFVFDGSGATDADKVKIYINGLQQVLAFKKNIPSTTPSAPSGGVLLGEDVTSGKLFTGLMDNVAIYNTSRTSTEVQYDMNNHPDSDQSGLVSYLPMNESGTATLAPDHSVNGNDGTLVNFPNPPSPWTTRAVTIPGTQATNVSASNVASTQQDLTWTNGSGSSRIVFMSQTTTGTPAPTNNTSYNASAEFGSGDTEPNGWYCMYKGTGNSVKISGLSASTDYRVMVCEYNGASGFENYNSNTASGNPANVPTNATIPTITTPTVQSSNLLCNANYTECNVSWTNGDGIKRLVFAKENAVGEPSPAENTSYAANSVYGLGDQEAGGWYCVYNGTETSLTITNLTPGSTYRVMTLEYNGGAGAEMYNTNTAVLNPVNFSKAAAVWLGDTNSDWGTANNWAGGVIPGITDEVFIPAGSINSPEIDNTTSANCKNLIVDASASLTINSAADGSAGSLIIAGTSTGNVTFNRYLSGGAWHLVSSPLAGQGINDLVTTSGNNIASNLGKFGLAPYNNVTPDWEHFTASTAPGAGDMTSGKGYEIIRSSAGMVSFSGTVQTGNVSIGIDAIADPGNSWNLVGNPYTSAINGNSPADATNNFLSVNTLALDDAYEAIYIWDASSTSYITINQTSAATFVAPGQAFFVYSEAGGSTVDFTKAMQTHQNSLIFKSGDVQASSIKLIAESSDKKTSTNIVFNEKGSTGLDLGFDAGRFNAGNNDFAVYTHLVEDDGREIDFDIQCLPIEENNCIVPIGINAPGNTEFVFRIETSGFLAGTGILLEDKVNDDFIDFSEPGSFYNVNIEEKMEGTGRFYIHITKSITGATKSSDNDGFTLIPQPKQNNLRILGNADGNSTISLFDMMGRKLIDRKLNSSGINDVEMKKLRNGTYIVFIQSASQTISKKINWIKN